jgi:hypothetical protein
VRRLRHSGNAPVRAAGLICRPGRTCSAPVPTTRASAAEPRQQLSPGDRGTEHADRHLAYRTPVQLKLSPYPETIHNRLRFQVTVGASL